MPRTGPLTRATLAAALLLAGGCAESSSGGATPDRDGSDRDESAWAMSTDPVEAGGLVWASDGVVHLPDGSTVDVGGPITTYVVAGDGVYFTPAASEEDGAEHSNVTTGPLHFADREGTVTDTGTTVYVASLGSSPDGRYLGLVDATSGPEDRFSGQPQATAVVLDLTTGERVVDTTDGMGDPQEDDLARDYQEVDLGVRFPDAGSAYVEGLDDLLYALPSGDGKVVDAATAGIRDALDPTSPSGEWAIEDRGLDDRLVSEAGDAVRPTTGAPRWDLRWWLDDTTVVGIAVSGPGRGTDVGPANTAVLVTCQVPDGSCSTVEGTGGKLLGFPAALGGLDLDLSDAGSAS